MNPPSRNDSFLLPFAFVYRQEVDLSTVICFAIVILRSPFDIEPIVNRLQNREDFVQERFVNRLAGPLRPLGDATWIGGAGDAGTQIRIPYRELQRELGNVHALR